MDARISLHRLDEVAPAALAATADRLEAEPAARLARMARPASRRRFLAAQTLLQGHLAKLVGGPPGRLRMARDRHGKPRLVDHPQLHFSLSHSGDWILIASAPVELGVDLEGRFGADRCHLAEAILDRETLERWRSLPEAAKVATLARAWCAREALLKLDGRGLGLAPSSLRLPLSLPAVACWDGGRRRAQVIALDAPAGFAACLASYVPVRPRWIAGRPTRLHCAPDSVPD